MIETRAFHHLPILFAAIIGVASPWSDAQETSAKPEAVAIEVDPKLPPLEVPPEILEQLNGMAKESSEAMEQVTELLKQNLATIENAEAIFDTMIETIRNAAANGAPDSEFVATLESLAKQARADAATAAELGEQQMSTYFNAAAAGFEESKGDAIAYYTSSFRNIRDIEREKKRFVLAMKVKQYELAKRNVQQGLDVLKDLDKRISDVRNALPDVQVESQ
jgi:hypothetical protein